MTSWPNRLFLVRHGESAGNVARDRALAAGARLIDIKERDTDVPLSDIGKDQSAALGQWLLDLPAGTRPNVLMTSPYLRASQTASVVGAILGQDDAVADERLREKEFGLLDRLTKSGIEHQFPEQAVLRARLGKFYYRPPQGESWCDVVFRLRSALDTICLHHAGKNVLIVGHQVVVLCFRYLLENLDEKRILEIDSMGEIANCAVTEYAFSEGKSRPELVRYNFATPISTAGVPVTAEPAKNVTR